MVEKQDVMEKLDEVEDPELELSIVELGLVYDVRFEEKSEGGLHAEVDLDFDFSRLSSGSRNNGCNAHRAALHH